MHIQAFDDINDSHAATGYRGRTDLPTFHIFTVEDTYPETRLTMPPYRLGFYQIVLLENSTDARLNLNTHMIADLSDTLTFASPEHVLTWVRGEAQRGFILFFKEEFLSHHPIPIQDDFPYFRLTEVNLLHVNGADKAALKDHCQRILILFQSDHPFRVQMLQALLLVYLYDIKRLYVAQQITLKESPPRNALAFRFQQFVNQHFLTQKTVDAYADLLAVSPDHLRQSVKAVTGKTAHHLIMERILLEAKKLLIYSDLTIAEIADYLGYSEPTHFGRVFRRHLGVSPLTWRQQQR